MKNLSEIISTTVVSLYESEYLGVIFNITFDYRQKKCKYACILNEEKNLLQVINFSDIYKVGKECVLIKNLSALELQTNHDKEFEKCRNPLNLPVYTIDGEYKGNSADMELDDEYNIINLVLNNGEKIASSKIINIGSIILISDKKINIAKFRPQRKLPTTIETRSDVVTILEPPKENSVPPTKLTTDARFLIGRIINKDIISINGEILAKKGMQITQSLLIKASLYGKLVELARYSK